MRVTCPKWLLIIIALYINLVIGYNETSSKTNCYIKQSSPNNSTEDDGGKINKNLNDSQTTTPSPEFLYSTAKISSPITTQPSVTRTTDTNSSSNTLHSPRTNSCKCGVTSFGTGKIIGGTPVSEHNSWPWFATLVRVDEPTKAHCGASLISPHYLLTAAHCLLPMMQVGLRNFKVKLGYNELDKRSWDYNQTKSVEELDVFYDIPMESVTIHPKFEQSFPFHYDIGVVKLSYPINCTNRVRPICLPPHENDFQQVDYANDSAITVGFGKTSINGNHSRVLQQIRLNLIPIDECRYNYSHLPFKPPALLDSMLCAWSKGMDSCVGDSGSPLFWRVKSRKTSNSGVWRNDTSYFEQIGLTSWGIGCANDKYPGVYSRIDKFVPWLKTVVTDLYINF